MILVRNDARKKTIFEEGLVKERRAIIAAALNFVRAFPPLFFFFTIQGDGKGKGKGKGEDGKGKGKGKGKGEDGKGKGYGGKGGGKSGK